MISASIQNSEPRLVPASFDLKLCLDCAKDAYRHRLELIPYFEKLKAGFSGVKGTDSSLPYGMTKKLTRRDYWNFEEFWMMPG